MEKIPDNILKYHIFPFFKNEITCCTDKTLYNLIFINSRFFKILSDTIFIKKIYKLTFLDNKHICSKCNNFDLLQIIKFYTNIQNNNNFPDIDIRRIYCININEEFIHFDSTEEFNNFEMFLLKNNITNLLLISKCCGGKGGNFRYIKN